MLDLSRWVNEEYCVPGAQVSEDQFEKEQVDEDEV